MLIWIMHTCQLIRIKDYPREEKGQEKQGKVTTQGQIVVFGVNIKKIEKNIWFDLIWKNKTMKLNKIRNKRKLHIVIKKISCILA